MTDWLSVDIICLLVLLTLVSVYVVVPMRLRRSMTLPVEPVLERIRLNQDVPSHVARFFLRAIHELETEGFTGSSEFYRARFSPDEAIYVTALSSRFVRDVVLLVGYPPRTPDPRAAYLVGVEFQTVLSEGNEIVTRNSNRSATNLPRSVPVLSVLTRVKDARSLHRIHMALLDRFGGSSPKQREEREGVRELLTLRYRRDLLDAVAAEYLEFDAEASVYRLTRKGAFLWIWRNLWPVSAYLAVMQRRQTARHTVGLTLASLEDANP
ncbi:MAG: hypothetical protein U1D30_18995 [Planctomycetota bacterium]